MTIQEPASHNAAEPSPPQRPRRRWSSDEKQLILRLAEDSGLSAEQVAQQHGLSVQLLLRWRQQEQEREREEAERGAAAPVGELAQARAEIARLQQLLDTTVQQNQVMAQVLAGKVPGFFETHPVPLAGVTWHKA